jgi:transcriptional regulator with XRE-family HTH domain
MQPAVAFGRVVRRLRQKKGLTQEELGLDADLRRTFVSILELGQQQPTLTTILKLARVLEVRPAKLIELVEREIQEFSGGGHR